MFGWLRNLFGGGSSTANLPGDTSSGGVFSGLRGKALSIQRDEVGIRMPGADAPVWGLLMETGYPGATATLLALADGTTSLYLSNGGGVIGGQAHASVREANAAFLATANQLRHLLKPAESYPIPAAGRTIFYARTDAGVLSGSGLEDELGHGRHPLSELFLAGHGVLTELRLNTEGAGL